MSLSIPTKSGFRSYGLSLNEPLEEAVETRNLVVIQDKLLELIDFAASQNTSPIPILEI